MVSPKFLISLPLTWFLLSCKTTRPLVEIQERPAFAGVGFAPEERGRDLTTLVITQLLVPPEAGAYTRIAVWISSAGEKIRKFNNYAVNDAIDIEPFRTYTLVVRAYQDSKIVSTNEYCRTAKQFFAKPGLNVYSIPLCDPTPPPDSTLEPDTDTPPILPVEDSEPTGGADSQQPSGASSVLPAP